MDHLLCEEKKEMRSTGGRICSCCVSLHLELKTIAVYHGNTYGAFMVAFLGCSVALMFTDWQNQVLEMKFPFDVQVNSQESGI